jgi:hypothetical protein
LGRVDRRYPTISIDSFYAYGVQTCKIKMVLWLYTSPGMSAAVRPGGSRENRLHAC